MKFIIYIFIIIIVISITLFSYFSIKNTFTENFYNYQSGDNGASNFQGSDIEVNDECLTIGDDEECKNSDNCTLKTKKDISICISSNMLKKHKCDEFQEIIYDDKKKKKIVNLVRLVNILMKK